MEQRQRALESVGLMAIPKISVIMLTYNREKLVGNMIECILGQTLEDFEFVIVNNGSTDRSGAIADEYAAGDSRIRVIHRQRGNIGSGRNAGLDAAKGQWIAFVDDDDWAEPDFLGFLYSLATENAAEVAICGAADKAFDEKRIMAPEEALIELMWRKRYNVGFPTKIFKAEIAQDLRFPEEGAYDDIVLMYRLLALAKRVAYHGLPKYKANRNGSNNSAWTTNHSLLTSETLEEYLQAYRERTEWLCGLFPAKAKAWRYFEWSFMISMVEKVERLGIRGCENQVTVMRQELIENQAEFLSCKYILDFEKEWMKEICLIS